VAIVGDQLLQMADKKWFRCVPASTDLARRASSRSCRSRRSRACRVMSLQVV